jgi:hypothetical protein
MEKIESWTATGIEEAFLPTLAAESPSLWEFLGGVTSRRIECKGKLPPSLQQNIELVALCSLRADTSKSDALTHSNNGETTTDAIRNRSDRNLDATLGSG